MLTIPMLKKSSKEKRRGQKRGNVYQILYHVMLDSGTTLIHGRTIIFVS